MSDERLKEVVNTAIAQVSMLSGLRDWLVFEVNRRMPEAARNNPDAVANFVEGFLMEPLNGMIDTDFFRTPEGREFSDL